MPIKRICCIGAGYVGGPTCAVIAKKCPDIVVTVTDIMPAKIAEWNSDSLPIFEPGLEEIVFEIRGNNLFFTTDGPKAIREADLIFISVNTPTKAYGAEKGKAPDLSCVESAARLIGKNASGATIIVEKSTVPVRAAESIAAILSAECREDGTSFQVLSNPEFLSEGTAIQDLLSPDRVLIGCESSEAGKLARKELADIYTRWVPEERIVTSNIWSSELTKLINNAMLAQKITCINATSAICEKTGADVSEVAKAVGMDQRIGPAFLNCSIGFGGSCFHKDILSLVYLCKQLSLDEVADYWQMIVDLNELQRRRFCQRIVKSLYGNVAGKKLAIFGFAFKENTGDTRESSAIVVCKHLLNEQAQLAIYDPKVRESQIIRDLQSPGCEFNSSSLKIETCPYEATKGASAIVICTEWKAFKNLNYQKLYDSMESGARWIFDGRNILDHQKLMETGFQVHCVGKALHLQNGRRSSGLTNGHAFPFHNGDH
ncbi:hypothetical protein RvY_11090 [Ramazzottius varieornatus]|uniref:UDP-glucose 6-dehydrogenase n=1 Tax=Ramazzottius varieornatus TaxID=947166 RepID=A0A1D1VHE9_RAMVA|nr:hypothetical protein RvY_11090 [Ramazzottius varieornatus]